MCETRGGVRQQLRAVIQETAERRHAELEAASSSDFADAILARFEVTEKPVVTAEELGRMMFAAYLGMHSTAEDNGMQLLGQLERAGLTIVRSGEAAR